MNFKTWVPLGAAIMLGLFAAKLGKDMLSQRQPAKVAASKTSQVVVAKEGIGPGAALKLTDLGVMQFPENGVPTGTFRTPEELAGRVIMAPLAKGQLVLENILAPTGTAGGLTAIVPDGMRAVTVEVNETSGVAGMLAPGCHVDIVTTISGDQSAPAVAKTIAKNLLIIAVGRQFGATGAPNTEGPPARSITLLASPKEAEIVELACRMGNPRMVLRGPRESHDVESEGTTLAELRSGTGFKAMLSNLLAPATRPATETTAVTSPATQPAARVPEKQYREVQFIKGGMAQTQKVEVEPPHPQMTKEPVVDVRGDLAPAPGTSD